MWSDIVKKFPAFQVQSEGLKDHMYCDSVGKVTTGMGNLLKPISMALELPWKVRATGAKATPEQITEDYNTCLTYYAEVTARDASAAAPLYKERTKLYLTSDDVHALVDRRVKGFATACAVAFGVKEWNAFPADAQMVCLAISWAIGVAPRWPVRKKADLHAAVLAGDFKKAATLCSLPVTKKVQMREWKNKAFKFMFENADIAKQMGGASPTLMWPEKYAYDADSGIAWTVDSMPATAPGKSNVKY